MSSQNEEKEKFRMWVVGTIVGGIWFAWLLLGLVFAFRGDSEISAAGVFGDFFGAINALFSSAAVALAVWAVLLQQKELKETREEFEKQTEIQNEHLAFLREEREARETLLKQQNLPRLMLRQATHGSGSIQASLINAGAIIYDLSILKFEGPHEGVEACTIKPDTLLERSQTAKVTWRLRHGVHHYPEGNYRLLLAYRNALDERNAVSLEIIWRLNA